MKEDGLVFRKIGGNALEAGTVFIGVLRLFGFGFRLVGPVFYIDTQGSRSPDGETRYSILKKGGWGQNGMAEVPAGCICFIRI